MNKLQVSATDYTIEITFDQIMIETDCKSLEITKIKVNFIQNRQRYTQGEIISSISRIIRTI